MKAHIGIDFAGVIIQHRKLLRVEGGHVPDPNEPTIAYEGVFEAVRELISFCNGRVWIVSKAGPAMQANTIDWLHSVDFFARTGMKADHVRFCLERPDKEPICREVGITHFIDDRIHIMQVLRHTVPNLYLFGEPERKQFCPPWSTYVTSWADAVETIKCSL